MKLPKFHFLVLTLSLAISCCTTASELCGSVSGTLEQAGSPYLVTCPISVPAGQTLTIEAGVEIRFALGQSMSVEGTLIAQGTEASPVQLTSDAPTPAPGDWGFVTIQGSAQPHFQFLRTTLFTTGST